MKKRILSILAVIIVCISCFAPTNVFAGTDSLLNLKLIAKGYPTQLLNILEKEQKEDLLDNKCCYESSKTYYYDNNGNLIDCISFDKDSVSTIGQIKDAHLTLSITSSKTQKGETKISFNYNWKTLPVNRYQDPIYITWDNSVFSLKADSFNKVDKFTYVLGDGSNGKTYTSTHSNEKSFADATFGYLSWYADLKGYTANVIQLFGYGSFTLTPKKKNVSTQIFGKYVHDKSALGVSLSFANGSVSISGTQYDEKSTSINIKS